MKNQKFLSVGMAFCDIPLKPCPKNIMEVDTRSINPVERHTGGDAQTVAIVLAKMKQDVSLAANIGADGNGQFLLDELKKYGVDTSYVCQLKGWSTATCYQLIEEDGERHFLVDSKINALLRSSDVPDEALEDAGLVFFGSALTLAGMDDAELFTLFQRAHSFGCITAMDASISILDDEECKMDLLRNALKETDIFIPSYEEASYLAQKTDVMEIMEAFKGFPFRIFGVKLGAEGCILTEDFEHFIKVEPYHVTNVVDTTGAGDCFMSGFLCAFMEGRSVRECAKFGSAVAAFGITDIGSSTAVPDYDTIVRFMKEHENL